MNILRFLISGYFFITVGCLQFDHEFGKLFDTSGLSSINSNDTTGYPDFVQVLKDLESLRLMMTGSLEHMVRSFSKNVTQDVFMTTQSTNGTVLETPTVSASCMTHMSLLLESLLQREDWALRMLDATGKLRSGLLDGNLWWLGSYDQCRRIENVKFRNHPNVPSFSGKMCYVEIPIQKLLVKFLGNYPLSVHTALCMPDSCSTTDTFLLSNKALDKIPLEVKAKMADCKENHLDYDTKAIVGIAVFGFIGFLLVCGSLYDAHIHMRKKNLKELKKDLQSVPAQPPHYSEKVEHDVPGPGFFGKLLLSFSVYSNSKKIMSTNQAGGALGAVNGIRFLSMSWVILGHTYVFVTSVNANSVYFLPHTLRRWSDLAVVNAFVSVDSFFALSGLLVAYLFLKEMKKNGGAKKTNWFMFYFHRLWRLSPAYWLVMFLDISLFRYMGNGLLWQQGGLEEEQCCHNWWTNLLYVNNFVHPDKMCFAWSWYLANDMQFYILSPLMLVPLYYSKIAGSVMCFLFLLANTIAAGVISSVNDLPPTTYSMHHPKSISIWFPDYYVKPYCRIGPYVVGIFTGYLLYRWKGQCNINKFVNLICWVISITCACAVVYGLHDYIKGGDMSKEVAALYNSIHRSVWGACICWIIFSCVTGNGGFINKILAWKVFIPLGRLSYCAYLVHPLVMDVYLGTLRSPAYLNDTSMIYMFLSHLVASYAIAFIASLAFESPMMALEKLIFRRGAKK